MRDREVKVGGVYWANVSGKRVKVKIIQEHRIGYVTRLGNDYSNGWDAVNLSTGRFIHILSGRRLHGEVRPAVINRSGEERKW